MKNNFKKWIALFLSVAMVAVSGITTNTSFLAAEYTEGQETTAGEEQSAVTETPASTETQESTETPEVTTAPTQETTETSDAENNADENSTEKTQVVDLDTTTITPTPTEAPTPTEEAGDKEEKQEEDQREPYTTSAEGVTVTANLGDQPDILPKNTQFVVTPVTDSTTGYNYDSYLQALNSNVGVDNNNPVYTSANTHFYDLAFLDVTKNMEVEPQGSVSISMQFAEPLSKEFGVASDSQVQIFHLKNTGNSKYKSNETGTISVENINSNNLSAGSSYAEFSLDSFSVIAVSVDPYITGDTDTSTNYQTVLGNAVDFGITTGTFTLEEGGDAETNVAAKVAKCTSQTGNDMTNDVEQTFILPEIDQGFNIKGPDNAAASLSNDVYVRTTSDNKSKITALGSVRLHIDDSETKEQLQAEVQAMLDHGESQSTQSLASHEATAKVVYGSDQKYKLDIRRGDAGTYYVNVDKSTLDGIQEADKLQIYKKNNQAVVFNVSSSDVTLWKFSVNNNGSDSLTGIKDDQYSSSIIWNLPNAKSVELRAIIGVVLAPKAAVKVAGTSAGWIVSSGVEIGNGEWHNIYRSVKKLRTEVSVSKKWEPSVPDKAEVDFTLYRNEKPTGKVITLDGTVDDNGETEPWKATFSNLPKCDTNGKDYNYTVRETDVRNADGFAASVSEANNGGTITNKKQATIDVSVSKEWDPTAPDKAEVEFTLYCNGDSTGKTITLDGTPDNNGETEAWKATFSNLPKCDADGQEYSYTVKETAVKNAKGFAASVSEANNGGTITNKKQATIDVSVSKKWEPSAPEKAEVDFTLYCNGDSTGRTITLDGTPDDNGETAAWKATFSNLPKCDTNGKDYNYTVRETDVRNADGFAASVSEANNGGSITNKKQATIDVSVSKEWEPSAPEKAEVDFTLYCNGDSTGRTITLDGTPDDNGETAAWKATFSNLPKCDTNGKDYNYTVRETDVRNADGFAASVSEANNGGTITNKKQATIDVSVSKEWDPTAPDKAEVDFTLYCNGDSTGRTITLDGTPDDNGETAAWKATFSNLPKCDTNGKDYNYTVRETDVRNADGFAASVSEANNGGTITNKKQATIDVSVSKEWDPTAPDKAEVDFTLYCNGDSTGKTITLDGTPDNNGETEAWKATFSNLPKCDADGQEYSYTVKETAVKNAKGFAASVSEANNGGTITNKKQATIDVSVSKEWEPSAPEKAEVEFTLYCNGDSTGKTITLDGTPDNNGESGAWKATFSNLPKCDADGQEYSYTVKETAVKNADGYTISGEEVENGGTITNTTDTSSAIIIRGTKTLANGTMTAGQFRFDLFENGKKIDTAANDADGKFTFAKIIYNPDDVSAGQTVTHTYTIKEENGGRTINGIRYSSEEKTVTVSVSKDKDGRMTVTSEGGTGSDSSFVNEKLRNLTVHKRWNDNNDEAGVRPSSITVDLQKGNTVVARAVLSESNGWSYTFTDLPYETYTVVEEEIGVDGYQAENGGIVVADTGTDAVTLVNDYNHPAVDIIANKVLTGATLTNGEFMFQLHRNSDPAGVITATAANNAAGEIIFSNIPYDPNGYTVTEVAGDDESITYDTEPVTFSAEGVVTSSDHPEFRNTYRPILLRVQKRSKEAPYDPLVGATYGLYQVVEGGNDILVESEISDENGYMYYGRIQPGVIYYFKEIAAPAGHEVDPYPGQKFQVKYTSNGQIALYDENGNPTTVGDITGQDSKNLLVQYTTEKTAVDTSSSLSYSDDSIVAVAKAENSKAFAAGTKLKVTQLSGSEAKTAAAAVEAACGKINSNIAYYDIQFIDASGNEVEPAGGDVTVTIQYKGNLDLPEGTDRTALKLVHLTKEANGETTVEAVPGTVAADQDGLLQTSFTADSFSTFGVVEPGSDNTLGQNYLVTAAGVADQVSELKVAKLDTAGKYIKGAKLQIIEKATGNVMAEWNTADGPQSFARWFDDAKTVPMNVDTYYILHEVSAPDGYQLADDILFMINKYDSSITVYKYDDNGKLVIDQEAIDKWVSDTTLQMIDVPVKHETVTLVKQKLVPNEKTIQGEDKIVHVTSIQAVRTGDTTPIALFVILLAAAAVVLLILVYRGRKKKDS